MASLNKKILEGVEKRLQKGQKTYGQDVDSRDSRDFVEEAIEEALDLCVYLTAELERIKELRDNPNLRKELNSSS